LEILPPIQVDYLEHLLRLIKIKINPFPTTIQDHYLEILPQFLEVMPQEKACLTTHHFSWGKLKEMTKKLKK
jgi:hypothetical protein